jgi:imidazolonepropionase-like amidohydrolase
LAQKTIPEEAMTQPVAFANANLIDGRGAPRPRSTVVVQGARILDVGSAPAASHMRVVDLAGRTLMPGMTIGHWHGEFLQIGPPHFSSGRGGVFLGTEQPPAVLALLAARALQLALLSGVTNVVSGSCSNDLDGQMQRASGMGVFVSPRITACSRHVVTTADYEDRGHWWKSDPHGVNNGIRRIGHNVFADGVPELKKAVRQEILRGAQIIKILPTGGHGFEVLPAYRGMSRDEMVAVVETAHEHGARVRAHVATEAGILECIATGVDIIDHADDLPDRCIEAMVKAGSFWCPSMLFSKMICYAGQGRPPSPGPGPDQIWDTLAGKLDKANAAGVKIVTGDDFGGQGMDHALGAYGRELEVYVRDMGVPAIDVLRWATFNGAQMSLDDQDYGSIEPGKVADLVVVDGDPSENIGLLLDPERNLQAVMLAGRFVKNELDALAGEGELPGFRPSLVPLTQAAE